MNVIGRWVAGILGHFRDQERSEGGAADRGYDAEYDDRESLPPFVQKEQHLERLAHQAEAEKENSETAHQRELVKWTRILAYTTGGLAFATFAVAGFAGWQVWEIRQSAVDTAHLAEAAQTTASITQRQFEAGQRAWLAPEVALLTSKADDSTRIGFRILLRNTGHEPAQFKFDKQVGAVPVDRVTTSQPKYVLGDDDKRYLVENNACPDAGNMEGQAIIFPSATPTDTLEFSLESPQSTQERDSMKAIIDGRIIFYFHACVTYVTLGKRHKTMFCNFLIMKDPGNDNKPTFKLCPTGQWAD